MSVPKSGQAEDWHTSIYDHLRILAAQALVREQHAQSLQPTMLVNDAYLKLMAQRNIDPADRSQIMATAATIIRRLLVDYARKRHAQKRGGKNNPEILLQSPQVSYARQIEVLELHDALETLEQSDPRAAQVVELKFFGGLTAEEIADQLAVSVRTVQSDWQFAKAWLYRELDANTRE